MCGPIIVAAGWIKVKVKVKATAGMITQAVQDRDYPMSEVEIN